MKLDFWRRSDYSIKSVFERMYSVCCETILSKSSVRVTEIESLSLISFWQLAMILLNAVLVAVESLNVLVNIKVLEDDCSVAKSTLAFFIS